MQMMEMTAMMKGTSACQHDDTAQTWAGKMVMASTSTFIMHARRRSDLHTAAGRRDQQARREITKH